MANAELIVATVYDGDEACGTLFGIYETIELAKEAAQSFLENANREIYHGIILSAYEVCPPMLVQHPDKPEDETIAITFQRGTLNETNANFTA